MDQEQRSLAIAGRKQPAVGELQRVYREDLAGLGTYFIQTRRGYENRRNLWAGKSHDLRKHGENPFPWDGASDLEAPVIDECIKAYVAILKGALRRANIRAYPTSSDDAAAARLVSAFAKWMLRSYVLDFEAQMERGSNYFFEKGLIVTYVGWEKREISGLQSFSLDQIRQLAPDLAEMIVSGGEDEGIVAMLQSQFPKLTKKRGLRAVKQLREKGETILQVSTKTLNRPMVESLAPDSDIFFPEWCIDPQKSPRMFRRVLLTEQEILNRVQGEGWDRDWADYVIEHHRGVQGFDVESGAGLSERSFLNPGRGDESDLFEIIYLYRRMIDEEDGSEGIYCTVFHPDFDGGGMVPDYAKHELLDQLTEYPVEVTRLSEDHKRLYDLQTFPDQLRSAQDQVKTERDARADGASLETLPPLMGPAGRRPAQWRPGGYVPRRRADEYDYAPTPKGGIRSKEVEEVLLKQAKMLVGLDPEDPLAPSKQQFYIDKYLSHVQKVVRKIFRAFLMYGDEEVFFRVTGYPERLKVTKADLSDEYDINISFDVLNNDPESLDRKLTAMARAFQFDRNGKLDNDAWLEMYSYAVDPIMADAIVQPSGAAVEQTVGKVLTDLSKVYSGIEVGAQPNGAAVAMQVIQAYVSQPDIQERLQREPEFAERLQKYAGQYQMQLMQQQNAAVGKLGTAPAMFQGANVGAA